MEKQKVIEKLASDTEARAQFNELLPMAIAHPHFPAGAARYLNASGFTPANLETLKYDIKKTYGISDMDVLNFVPEKTDETDTEETKLTFEEIAEKLNVNLEELNYQRELKPLALEVSKSLGHELPNMKTETLLSYLSDQKAKSIDVSPEEVENAYKEATDDAKEGLKFRNEFPFLSEPDAPQKLKALVTDKFTALQNYEEAHEQIQKMKATGETEGLFELGKKAVENWELNQLIYDELNYYQEHKEILGNHPIFADDMLQKTVNDYKEIDLKQLRANLRSRISQEKSKLKKAKTPETKEKIEGVIAEKQKEIDLIEKRLANAEKK